MVKGFKNTEVGPIPNDWELCSLGEIGSFKNGINKGKEDFGHGSPFVNLLDVFGKNYIDSSIELGLINSNDFERQLYSLKKGDVIFVRSSVKPSGVGLTILCKEDLHNAVFSGFLIRFRDNGKIDLDFKIHCFYEEGFRKRLISNSTVSANTNINQVALKALLISLPPTKAEQTAIATALNDADALIQKLEQLITKKRNIKTGAMQELLKPKEGWEVKKLGEVADKIVGGGTPSRSNATFWNGDIPWVTVKDFATFNQYGTQEYITSEGLKSSASNLIPRHTLITSTRMGLGRSVIYEVDVSINQDLKAIFPKPILNTKFLFYWFQKNAKLLSEMGSGSTVMGLSLNDLRNIPFSLPRIAEQTYIAQILSDMDNEIQELEKQLEKYKMMKQGMMQSLLTGKIRLL